MSLGVASSRKKLAHLNSCIELMAIQTLPLGSYTTSLMKFLYEKASIDFNGTRALTSVLKVVPVDSYN